METNYCNLHGNYGEREKNEKISVWLGRVCSCVTELDSDNLVQGIPQYTTYWGGCPMHSVGGHPTPYTTSDRCAVELISDLSKRGYKTILESYPDGNVGYGCQISKGPIRYSSLQPTIAGAVASATLGVIDRDAESI